MSRLLVAVAFLVCMVAIVQSIEEQNDSSIRIHVRNLTGKTITFIVDPNDTLETIKEKISEKSGIIPDNQRLIFNGKELTDNNQTLAECGVRHETIMHIVVRLPGGMRIFVKNLAHLMNPMGIESTKLSQTNSLRKEWY